ncbi:MAG: cohesin domain-containing protein [bacterium]|nr:cohesin domain-containing protein [bacterium]
MQKSKIQVKIKNSAIFLVFSFLFFVAVPVFAAQISFDAKTEQAHVGKKIEVTLLINTEQENINAFEGNVTFPNDLLNLKEIRYGNTIVNFWIEKPKAQDNTIVFSGITPGGFNGKNGLIFSAIFEAKKKGIARFEVNDARMLRNDGIGSMAVVSAIPFEMMISEKTQAEIPALLKKEDHEQPELFMPEIAKTEALFEGKRFLVFATQDKISGLDYYTIKESRQNFFTFFSKWSQAKSPYVLQDQELRSSIFVKAVDNAGNKRIVKIMPSNPLMWYENYENWVIIILGLLIAHAIKKFLWRKRIKK